MDRKRRVNVKKGREGSRPGKQQKKIEGEKEKVSPMRNALSETETTNTGVHVRHFTLDT